MKNIKTLIFFGLTLFITSCATNDSDVTISDTDLIGAWNLTEHYTENGIFAITQNGVTINATYQAIGSNFDFIITFSDNPKTTTSGGSYVLNATVSMLGQTETWEENVEVPANTSGGSWSLENGILTMSEQGESVQAEVIDFDGTTLKLKFSLDKNLDLGTGESANISGQVYMTFTK